MDFELGPEAEGLRQEVRAFLAEHLTDELYQRMADTGTYYDAEFTRALGQRGWIAPGWPESLGGGGRSWLEQVVLSQELRRAEAPMDGIGTTLLIAETLRLFGSAEQQADIMGPAVRGEVVIALGYSEPDSGSDAAAARTRAVADGQEWLINGEKMFTTLSQVADYIFVLARTNTEAKKHRGLTTFLVPTRAAGFSVSEVRTLGGERTNITTYEEVRVPDSLRVGDVNSGWTVACAALELEHGITYADDMDQIVHVALQAARERTDDAGQPLIDSGAVRARLARAALDAEVSQLLGLRANWMHHEGLRPTAEGSMSKLYSSEAFARSAGDLLDIFGPAGLAQGRGLGEDGVAKLEHAYRHSQVTRIYAGTSEIHRSLIAEAGLGLPRTR